MSAPVDYRPEGATHYSRRRDGLWFRREGRGWAKWNGNQWAWAGTDDEVRFWWLHKIQEGS